MRTFISFPKQLLLTLHLILSQGSVCLAANYIPAVNGNKPQIELDQVLIDGTVVVQARLTALDDQPIYSGQIYELTSIGSTEGAIDNVDAGYTSLSGLLVIPYIKPSSSEIDTVLLRLVHDSPMQFSIDKVSSMNTNIAENEKAPKSVCGIILAVRYHQCMANPDLAPNNSWFCMSMYTTNLNYCRQGYFYRY